MSSYSILVAAKLSILVLIMTLPLVFSEGLVSPRGSFRLTICVSKSLAVPVALTLPPLRYGHTHKRSHRCVRTHPPVAGLWGRLACCVQV